LFWTKTRLLKDEIDFLRSQVAQLQNYILLTGQTPGQHFTTTPAFEPGPDLPETPAAEAEAFLQMAMSEAEEDVEWARQAGDITDARAKQLLDELQRERHDEL
jgi:hypothetical protein